MAAAVPLQKDERMAAAVIAVCALFCFAFPFVLAPVFERNFGNYYGLPALTELALTVWFPLMLGLNPASVGFFALNQADPVRRRRFLLVAGVMGIAACLLCIGAMVLPPIL